MSDQAQFPIALLALAKKKKEGTAPGAYLRWFVKPYLGIPGIDPLRLPKVDPDEFRKCGFRLFYNDTNDEIPAPEDLAGDDPIFEGQKRDVVPLAGESNWRVDFREKNGEYLLELDFLRHARLRDTVIYLRIAYRLYHGQKLLLKYEIGDRSTNATEQHEVRIHYNRLIHDLEQDQCEALAYAIQVDQDPQFIKRVRLLSNQPIVLGEIQYAVNSLLPFYIWSPAGGRGLWREVKPEWHLLRELGSDPVLPGPHSKLVDAMREFYGRYHGLPHHRIAGNQQIAFEFPDLSGFSFPTPALREYVAEEYGKLCEGAYGPQENGLSSAHIPPQDAAILASIDPAAAYLVGLFRVLKLGRRMQKPWIFKIQGVWPENRRFCVYSKYDPKIELIPPQSVQPQAVQAKSRRVLRDYETFRTHHRINVADISWKKPEGGKARTRQWLGPAAYVVIGRSHAQKTMSCRSPFYLPQEWETTGDPARVHYVDWRDFYRQTDIPKVLDGDYDYHVAAIDIFGQLSDFRSHGTTVTQARLSPGEALKPQVRLSRVPDPAGDGQLAEVQLPLEVESVGTGYQLRKYNRDYLEFDFSFYWPLAARYLWNRNRRTGTMSVDFFQLLYLVDVPPSVRVAFDSVLNSVGYVSVDLEGVAPQGKNEGLYNLLAKLDAVGADGSLEDAKVRAALGGGALIVGRGWDVIQAKAAPAQAKVTISLIPSSDQDRELFEKPVINGLQFWIPGDNGFVGQLYWNSEATHGGSRIGWSGLTGLAEKIRPPKPFAYAGALIEQMETPTPPITPPEDLPVMTGVIVTGGSPARVPASAHDYDFIIRLREDDEQDQALMAYDRLLVIPHDPTSGLAPGEYDKGSPPLKTDVEFPASVQTLFSEDLIICFEAKLWKDESNGPRQRVYKGQALPFTSNDAGSPDEGLLFPDPQHYNWIVVPPTMVEGKSVPLAKFTQKGFNSEHLLTTSITVGLLTKVSSQDKQVTDCIQPALATMKLSLVQYLPPPELKILSPPPPEFGVDAGPPDFYGISAIRIGRIYDNIDLASRLGASSRYNLYRLPVERVLGHVMEIAYAQDEAGFYRRNMQELKQKLDLLGEADPLGSEELQESFRKFGQLVSQTPLGKEDFLKHPVELPGESRSVFLFAIKAQDPVSGKESKDFTCLSPPVYVEDPTSPGIPRIRYAGAVLTMNQDAKYELEAEICVARRIDLDPIFGYAAMDEMSESLLGPDFCHIVARYRLYLTTGSDEGTMECPDDSDFLKIDNANYELGASEEQKGLDVRFLSVELYPTTLEVNPAEDGAGNVIISGRVKFHESIEAENLPSRLYMCVRAENYLGRLSPLLLTPIAVREVMD